MEKMQSAETENNPKSRSDEESINFRPSPNFKHMKKYLKSKFEENQMISQSASSGAVDSPDVSNEKSNKPSTQEVQPPLPPNPPPPDSPPIINLKKEIEDDEYQCNNENVAEFNQVEELTPEMIKTDQSEPTEKIMCRNFIRGTCKKEGSCIFAHELILSQLQGVYTFCRNFQNSVCTLPKCKFVHATVFEKEYFYRTGYLPPHTKMHLKEGNVLQPPPPPPEEVPAEASQVFSAQPPPPPPSVPGSSIEPAPVITCAVVPTVEQNEIQGFRNPSPGSTSPKRTWSETVDDSANGSPCDHDCSESLVKKCKACDSNEFRFKYYQAKFAEVMHASEKLDQKFARLNEKSAKLYSILEILLKPSSGNGMNGVLDKEKVSALDAFKLLLPKLPVASDEAFKTNLPSYQMLTKYMKNAESGVPPDTP